MITLINIAYNSQIANVLWMCLCYNLYNSSAVPSSNSEMKRLNFDLQKRQEKCEPKEGTRTSGEKERDAINRLSDLVTSDAQW